MPKVSHPAITRLSVGNHLTEESVDLLCEEYVAGGNIRGLHAKYGVDRKAISAHLHARGIPIHPVKGERTTHVSNRLYQIFTASAKSRNLEWGVTIHDIEALYQSQRGLCYYTGIPLNLDSDTARDPYRMSLDRKNSSKGYTKDNVCLCCMTCNFAKSDWPEQVFVDFLAAVRASRP